MPKASQKRNSFVVNCVEISYSIQEPSTSVSGASSAGREESVVVLEKHPRPLGSQSNTLDQQLQQTEVCVAIPWMPHLLTPPCWQGGEVFDLTPLSVVM